MKGIVFLLLAPFEERDYSRFGIEFLDSSVKTVYDILITINFII